MIYYLKRLSEVCTLNKKKVKIIADLCFRHREKIGAEAVVEGEFPRHAVIVNGNEIIVYDYFDMINSRVIFNDGTPAANIIPLWQPNERLPLEDMLRPVCHDCKPKDPYWFVVYGKRATLCKTGEGVWDDEVLWQEIDEWETPCLFS